MTPYSWGIHALEAPWNFTSYRDSLRPYEMGIGAYFKVNNNYFNQLAYASITKIALL